MNQLTLENLPQEAKDSLPQEAQRLFLTAYNSLLDNTKSEEAALKGAWQTIEHNEHYVKGEDGKWHYYLPEETGGSHGALGSQPQS